MPLFAFRNQPLKTIYVLYAVLSILFVRLPYWSLCALVPAWRPRPTWPFARSVATSLAQAFVHVVYSIGFFAKDDPEKSAKSANKLGFVWVDPVPIDYLKGEIASLASVNNVQPARVHGYWYGKDVGNGLHGAKAEANEKVLYHLHGKYSMSHTATAKPLGPIAAGYAIYVNKCTDVFTRAFLLEYRLCSAAPFKAENAFPSPLIDALAGYRYLVETLGFKPSHIILSGDSAGGHLALNLARYLVQESLPTLPPPGALVLHSPVGDFAGTHDSNPDSSMRRHARTDMVGSVIGNGYAIRALCGALPEDSVATNAWISPSSLRVDARGLFVHFPPTIMFVGGAEQMLDNMKALYARLSADNEDGRMSYVEYPDATHDFMLVPFHEPETTQGAQALKHWLRTIYPPK